MSRPMALGLVLLVLILTSQSDWKQEPKVESDMGSSTANSHQHSLSTRESVKKEIILIQEKEIYKLKLKVKSLEEQLKKCQCEVPENNTVKTPVHAREIKHQEKHREDSEQPLSVKSSKLRGSVTSSLRDTDLSKHPAISASGVPSTGDALETAEEEEEKLDDR